jgi:hypothetical protein
MNIRNEDGIWINSTYFSEAANHFNKYGRYCDAKKGTSEWTEFWTRELDRRINGFSVGGARITGDHYNYLNYSRIKKIPTDGPTVGRRVRKVVGFPDFIDGDYDFFWNLAISEFGSSEKFMKSLRLINEPKFLNGGANMIVSKSRRKGYSYKMAAVASNRYDTVPDAIVLLMAYEKKYLYGRNGIFDMAKKNADFLNEHTAWTKKREKIDTKDSIKASYIQIDRNTKVPLEKGYCSQITSVSFHDDPDGSRGVDFDLGIVDEGGKFPNWQDSYHAMLPSQEAGMYKTGFLIVFGTGGDMDGGTVDFSDHFYNAETFGYNCYKNTWDEGSVKDGGYFHPQYIGEQGFIDGQGNSKVKEAKEYEQHEREKLKKAGKVKDLAKRTVEHAQSPGEAFMNVGSNPYPSATIKAHLDRVIKEDLFLKTGFPIEVYQGSDGKWTYRIDFNLQPFTDYPVKEFRDGCIMMFKPPNPKANKRYTTHFSGYDPVQQDFSEHSNSIMAFTLYEADTGDGSGIVLTYYGRPGTDAFNDNIIGILEMYGCQCMHENMGSGPLNHFDKRKKVNLLADRPDYFLKKTHVNSSSGRVIGCHMNAQIRRDAVSYDIEWMLTERDVDPDTGEKILNLHTITDIGLLKEYIAYDGIKNTDRVDSVLLMRIHAADQEFEVVEKAKSKDKDDAFKQLSEYLSNN